MSYSLRSGVRLMLLGVSLTAASVSAALGADNAPVWGHDPAQQVRVAGGEVGGRQETRKSRQGSAAHACSAS